MAPLIQILIWQYQGSSGIFAAEYHILQVANVTVAKHKMIATPEHIQLRQITHFSWKSTSLMITPNNTF